MTPGPKALQEVISWWGDIQSPEVAGKVPETWPLPACPRADPTSSSLPITRNYLQHRKACSSVQAHLCTHQILPETCAPVSCPGPVWLI